MHSYLNRLQVGCALLLGSILLSIGCSDQHEDTPGLNCVSSDAAACHPSGGAGGSGGGGGSEGAGGLGGGADGSGGSGGEIISALPGWLTDSRWENIDAFTARPTCEGYWSDSLAERPAAVWTDCGTGCRSMQFTAAIGAIVDRPALGIAGGSPVVSFSEQKRVGDWLVELRTALDLDGLTPLGAVQVRAYAPKVLHCHTGMVRGTGHFLAVLASRKIDGFAGKELIETISGSDVSWFPPFAFPDLSLCKFAPYQIDDSSWEMGFACPLSMLRLDRATGSLASLESNARVLASSAGSRGLYWTVSANPGRSLIRTLTQQGVRTVAEVPGDVCALGVWQGQPAGVIGFREDAGLTEPCTDLYDSFHFFRMLESDNGLRADLSKPL